MKCKGLLPCYKHFHEKLNSKSYAYHSDIILLCTAVTTALITGLLYAYSCSVNPGLGKLPAEGYIAAMQSINRAIQNPLFFLSFMGTAILLPVCTYMHYHHPLPAKFYLLLTATILYLGGVLGVTILGNIPLNDALDNLIPLLQMLLKTAKQKIVFMQQWNAFILSVLSSLL
ncbi:MAG: anthrone oxygenase family protein [Bacteroidota bacterium]